MVYQCMELYLHGMLIQDKRSEGINRCNSAGNVDVEIVSESIAAKHSVKAKEPLVFGKLVSVRCAI